MADRDGGAQPRRLPVDRLDAALTAVAEVIGDPQDSRRSFVVTAKDGEEPEVKEMTD